MRNHYGTVLNQATGRPLIGAQVRVLEYPGGDLATIYSDANGTETDNPLTVANATTSAPGFYLYYADDGFYTEEHIYGGSVIKTIPDIDISADLTNAQAAAASGASLIGTSEVGESVVTLENWLRSGPIYAISHGVVGDGSAADYAAMNSALQAAITLGRKLVLPAGTFNISQSLMARSSSWLSYFAAFAPGVEIEGQGPGRTILNFTGSGACIDVAPTHDFLTFKALSWCKIKGLTIRGSGEDGIKFRSVVNMSFEDLHIIGLTGDGIQVVCTEGDTDGSVMVDTQHVRIENCGGWGFSGAADPGHNEVSFVNPDGLFVQGCGTAEEKFITSFTAANPGVFTSAAHGFADDLQVRVAGTGKSTLDKARYRLKALSADTFKLQTGSDSLGWTDLNTTSMGAYSRTATITGITAANPPVVSATAHGFTDGTPLRFSGIVGMTELNYNASTNTTIYFVSNAAADTFELQTVSGDTYANLNASGYTAWTSGGVASRQIGHVWPAEPSSGGIKWKGQIARVAGAAALCKNCGFYGEGGSGLPQDLKLDGYTSENNGLISILITGISGMYIHPSSHMYQNSSFSPAPAYHGLLLDGTNSVVRHVTSQDVQVRNTPYEKAFEAFTVIGANAVIDTIDLGAIWKADGWSGQTRYSANIRFKQPVNGCELRLVNNEGWVYGPHPNGSPNGNVTAVRTRVASAGTVSTGGWRERHVSSGGLALSNATGLLSGSPLDTGSPLALSTTYNVYLLDAGSGISKIGCSTTAPVVDAVSGMEVMTGDANLRFVGRVRTGSGNAANGHPAFETTNLGWLNPIRWTDPVAGTQSWIFHNSADGNIWLKVAGTRPSSALDGSRRYAPSVEYSQTSVAPGSIAAGGLYQTTFTTGVTATVGEEVLVSTTAGTTDNADALMLSGGVVASNTLGANLFNPTGAAIDPGTITIRYLLWRRV